MVTIVDMTLSIPFHLPACHSPIYLIDWMLFRSNREQGTKMDSSSRSAKFLPFTFFIILQCFLHALADTSASTLNNRETQEVNVAPPAQYSSSAVPFVAQPLQAYESSRIQLVAPVIRELKRRITYDPKNITQTWTGFDICHKYKGFFCDNLPDMNRERALAGVNFNGFNFNGPNLTLSGIIENMPDLAFFHANSNNFTGTLSPKIGNIRYLYELDLSNNNFTGKFPLSVLRAKNLTFLDLRFNKFVGSVPSQVFNLDVDVLFINNNGIMQQIPTTIGNTPALYLTLANNKFQGPIPRALGKASNTLTEVLFLNNNLSGCLPYEIGSLNRATVFDASKNQLTGPIPLSFGCLKRMQILSFIKNRLYGPIPEVLCQLPNLVRLSLSYNFFTQVGPVCRALIRKKVLDVRKNCILDLPGQKTAAECGRFFSKALSCPVDRSVTRMPCRVSSMSQKTSFGSGIEAVAPSSPTPINDHSSEVPASAPSPTYAALNKHRS